MLKMVICQEISELMIGHNFYSVLSRKAGKYFNYDDELAENAEKHSEYMLKQKKLCDTPKEFMEEIETEIVCSAKFKPSDLNSALVKIIDQWMQNSEKKASLKKCNFLGTGIAFDEKSEIFYLTARFR